MLIIEKQILNRFFIMHIFFPVVELLSSIAIALIIWYGGGEVVQNNVGIGSLFAFIQFTEMFFRPIRDLSEKYNIMQTAMASSERIFKLLDNQTFIENPENPIKLNRMLRVKLNLKMFGLLIMMKNYVLKNIYFQINPGETVAIVGQLVREKPHLLNILTRFYDIQKGSVLLME